MMHESSVYIMSSHTGVLYIGVTSDLKGRVWEHKNFIDEKSFTAKYQCTRLVYYEDYDSIVVAIDREKQLKKSGRRKKEALIIQVNSEWKDLSEEWY